MFNSKITLPEDFFYREEEAGLNKSYNHNFVFHTVEEPNYLQSQKIPFGRASQIVRRDLNGMAGDSLPLDVTSTSDMEAHGEFTLLENSESEFTINSELVNIEIFKDDNTRSYGSFRDLPSPSELSKKKKRSLKHKKQLGQHVDNHFKQVLLKTKEFTRKLPELGRNDSFPTFIRVHRNDMDNYSERTIGDAIQTKDLLKGGHNINCVQDQLFHDTEKLQSEIYKFIL